VPRILAALDDAGFIESTLLIEKRIRPGRAGGFLPRLAINIVRYNQEFSLLERAIGAALNQELEDFEVVLTENGSSNSVKEPLLQCFGSDRRFRYVENASNLGFAGAHNRFIQTAHAEFVLPLNPDTQLTPEYARTVLAVFRDSTVAAAEGKMLKPVPLPDGRYILDGTGMSLSRGRRAGERGQLQVDEGQFDDSTDVFGVSATAAIYRTSALERIKHGEAEYFDEDLFTYWEDLDLAWRLRLAGFQCRYVPRAIVYHARSANQSDKGFTRVRAFVAHTRSVPLRIVQWDWRNHLLTVIKNDFGSSLFRDLPRIAVRESVIFAYLCVVRPQILFAVPEFFRLLPKILRKRKLVQRSRTVSSREMGQWFESAQR
jgi:GT2 family glycosyltransferase